MTIDWWTLLLQTINFLLLVWLLRRFLYKPVRAVIEKRRQLAEQALTAARTAEQQAETEKTELEAKTAELEQHRQAAIAAARQEAETEAGRILAGARKQAEAIVAEAHKTAEDERVAALSDLRQDIAATAVEIAQTILRKTANSSLNSVFLSRIMDEAASLSEADRARLEADIASGQAELEVATPTALIKTEQESWANTLTERFHLKRPPKFSVQPDLVGGAELRFPHATIRFAWADHLRQAEQLLEEGGKAS